MADQDQNELQPGDSVSGLVMEYGQLLERHGAASSEEQEFLNRHASSTEFMELAETTRELQLAAELRNRAQRAARRNVMVAIIATALVFAIGVFALNSTTRAKEEAKKGQQLAADSLSLLAHLVPDPFVIFEEFDPSGLKLANERVKRAYDAMDEFVEEFPPRNNADLWRKSPGGLFLWVRGAYVKARSPKEEEEGDNWATAFEDDKLNAVLVERYELFVEMFPQFGPVHRYMAGYYYAKGDLTKAIEILEIAVELGPNDFLALNSLAWILYKETMKISDQDNKKKQLEKALGFVERAIRIRVESENGTRPRLTELPLSEIIDTAYHVCLQLEGIDSSFKNKADLYLSKRNEFVQKLVSGEQKLGELEDFKIHD